MERELEKVTSTELILYSLEGCCFCELLLEKLLQLRECVNLEALSVAVEYFEKGTSESNLVRPRLFPTVIAYKNGIPRLGWEGFAAMTPEEIQDAMVLDVLRQAAALADEPDEAPSGEANDAAGAARSEADGGAP